MKHEQARDLYGHIVKMYAGDYGVPENIVLGVIMHESGGDFLALGPTGDYGLMQITSPALKDFNRYNEVQATMYDIYHNPGIAIMVGTWYLSKVREYMHGASWYDVLRGYNWGPGRAMAKKENGADYAEAVYLHIKIFEEMI